MAFCKYCGGKVNEGALFCAACGKKLRNEADDAVNWTAGGVVPPPIPVDYEDNKLEATSSDICENKMLSQSIEDAGNNASFVPASPVPKMSSDEGMGSLNIQGDDANTMPWGYQMPQGFSTQQGGQIPQGYPIQQGGQIPQGYPIQQGWQMMQGYPVQQAGQMPQGYPMQQGGQIPQGYPMQQGGQMMQGYPLQSNGQFSQGFTNVAPANMNVGSYHSVAPMKNEPRIEVIIDGEFGQILKAYNDYFIVETSDEFECYEPEARKIYQSKGASEKEKGVLEEFADVGKELGSIYGEAFAMFGEAFSSTYAEKRKKKKGVLTIPEGERKEYYAACATIEGINIGQEKRGCIIIRAKTGEEILFFFDGTDEDIDEKVSEVFSEVMQPKIHGQMVNHSISIGTQAGVVSVQQPMVGSYNNSPAVEGDKVEQIKRIKELLDTGAISKREFARMKKEILKK